MEDVDISLKYPDSHSVHTPSLCGSYILPAGHDAQDGDSWVEQLTPLLGVPPWHAHTFTSHVIVFAFKKRPSSQDTQEGDPWLLHAVPLLGSPNSQVHNFSVHASVAAVKKEPSLHDAHDCNPAPLQSEVLGVPCAHSHALASSHVFVPEAPLVKV